MYFYTTLYNLMLMNFDLSWLKYDLFFLYYTKANQNNNHHAKITSSTMPILFLKPI